VGCPGSEQIAQHIANFESHLVELLDIHGPERIGRFQLREKWVGRHQLCLSRIYFAT
jgi:hypothetical protein